MVLPVRFETGKHYRVKKVWRSDVNDDLRLQSIRDDLAVDEVLRFRGPNMGFAEFIDNKGRIAFLSRAEAFDTFDITPVSVAP
jgi:hypothetical protein